MGWHLFFLLYLHLVGRKLLKWLTGILLTVIGLALLVVLLVQTALSGPVLTSLLEKYLPPYVDGEMALGRASVDLFRSFPNLHVEIHDLTVTYPHDRFAQFETGVSNEYTEKGRGEAADTLFSVGTLSANADYVKFLKDGELEIPKLTLSGLRAYLHFYDRDSSNLAVLRLPASKDTTSSGLPEMSIGKVLINGDPEIVYSSLGSDLYASLTFDNLSLKGKIESELLRKLWEFGERPERERIVLSMDELAASVAFASDRAEVTMDRLDLFEHVDHMDLQLTSDASYDSQSFGHLSMPVDIDAEVGFPRCDEGDLALAVKELMVDMGDLSLEAAGDVLMHSDSIRVDISAVTEDCPVGNLWQEYGPHFIADASDITTDAYLTAKASAKGWFSSATGAFPVLNASLEVPDSHFSYAGLVDNALFDLTLAAEMTSPDDLNAVIDDLCFEMDGIDLNLSGAVDDVLGGDPLITVKGTADTWLEKLVAYLPADAGIRAEGQAALELDGSIRPSQLSLYNFSSSSLYGKLSSDRIVFSMPGDTLYARMGASEIRLAPASSSDGGRVAVSATVDDADFTLGSGLSLSGKRLTAQASNSTSELSGGLHPLNASLAFQSLEYNGGSDLNARLLGSSTALTITKENDSVRPKISASNSDRALFLRSGVHRVSLQGVTLSAAARMRDKAAETSRFSRDSLGRISRDSLRSFLPDFLSEADFRTKDIDIHLDSTLRAYFQNWNPQGSVKVQRGTLATPLLPLRNIVNGFEGSFTEDQVKIKKLDVTSGTTSISADGTLKGLKRALTSRGMLDLDLDLKSDRVNMNELLAALEAGSAYVVPEELGALSDDEQYLESIVIDTLSDAAARELDYSLIILPANVRANVNLDAARVDYSTLSIDSLRSDMRMQERCLQLTNTAVVSDLGSVFMDAFYSTKTKTDISAGFNVLLKDITADRVISLVPAVDSLVPMLKSFQGNLNCEIAATTQLDTNMNVKFPSINGVVKLRGNDLLLADTGDLRKIAQLLMFKDTDTGHISDMSLYGMIASNQLEVFPFILGVDRYTLALKGLQSFDGSFDYHISIIDSPLPFKFGLNLMGDSSDWKYSIGKALYKSKELPHLRPMVDQMQEGLKSSILNVFDKGVFSVLRSNLTNRKSLEARLEEENKVLESEDELLTSEEALMVESMQVEMEIEAEEDELQKEIDELMADFY